MDSFINSRELLLRRVNPGSTGTLSRYTVHFWYLFVGGELQKEVLEHRGLSVNLGWDLIQACKSLKSWLVILKKSWLSLQGSKQAPSLPCTVTHTRPVHLLTLLPGNRLPCWSSSQPEPAGDWKDSKALTFLTKQKPWPLLWPCWRNGWAFSMVGWTEMGNGKHRDSFYFHRNKLCHTTISHAWVGEMLFPWSHERPGAH